MGCPPEQRCFSWYRDYLTPRNGFLKGCTLRVVDGLRIVPGYLDRAAQAAMRDALQDVFARAPLYTPRMPKTGKPMSVRMTNCGPLGWVTDAERGYRYQADPSGNRRTVAADARRCCSTRGASSRTTLTRRKHA